MNRKNMEELVAKIELDSKRINEEAAYLNKNQKEILANMRKMPAIDSLEYKLRGKKLWVKKKINSLSSSHAECTA